MEMNWDYIAGFFDGEGCLHCHKYKDISHTYTLVMNQNTKEVLNEIKKFLEKEGIKTFDLKRQDRRYESGIKIIYDLRIKNYNSINKFLRNIQDKVIVKRDAVKRALNDPMYTKKWTHLSDFDIDQAKILYGYGFPMYKIEKILDRHNIWRLKNEGKLGVKGICL